MTEPNAADRKWVREQQKLAKLVDARNQAVVVALMGSADGRAYMWDKLERAHIYHTSFSTDPLQMAFNEGERNLGLQLQGDLILWCPEEFIQMMREANGRRTSSAAGGDTGERGSRENIDWRDQGPAGDPTSGLGESGHDDEAGDEDRTVN